MVTKGAHDHRAVVNLRVAAGCTPYSSRFSQFHAVFFEIFEKLNVDSTGVLASLATGNPGSALAVGEEGGYGILLECLLVFTVTLVSNGHISGCAFLALIMTSFIGRQGVFHPVNYTGKGIGSHW